LLRPSVRAGVAIGTWGTRPFDVGINELVGALNAQGAIAAGGDLSRLEEMLAIQAHTLDAVFNEYTKLAKLNLAEYPAASESFMRLGLKAQSQCRATVESLAAVKTPPAVAFVRQANIANGHQQVNNGNSETRARGNQFQADELLEQSDARLDTRATPSSVIGNPALAALGTIDGAEKRSGQETGEQEQLQARCAVARRS
jgi:hypothetical protein